ncbi:MAG: methyltransferase domain-containing protein [Rouxiella aceris]|uniref:class I SAM-dependent methyltransferase n=1 Tax=Rouxiella aceris TaxID=2703884 RepID=UPI00284EDAB2|nr:methyltransferase domain-containing protein [Rouxiella aceris]MDR3432909.1 methyltransferase domain-containing protein [Rouxiella aceris]
MGKVKVHLLLMRQAVKNPVYLPYPMVESRLEQQLAETVRSLPPRANEIRLLDYGSGYGIRSERVIGYLHPQKVKVHLFDVDANLLAAAQDRISKIAPVERFTDRSGQFDLILCLSVLEMIPDEQIIASILETLRRHMHNDSLLVIQHVNWHPLAVRSAFWFVMSFFHPSTIGSASRTREAKLGPRNYAPLGRLLGQINEAGLRVNRVVRGPYIKQIYLPFPDAVLDRNLLLLSL